MLNEDWPVLTSLFPADWRALAARCGALKGLRKDKSADTLLRTLLLHVAGGHSLRETASRARKSGLADLSDVALLKRLRKSREWLRAMCVALLRDRGLEVGGRDGQQFRLFDATNVKEPGKTGSLWRIHYSVCIPSLDCDFFSVTPAKGAGTGESLAQFPVSAGDRIIADRGYSHASGIHYAAARGATVCIRLNPYSIRLLDLNGNPLDLLPLLRSIPSCGEARAWPVLIPGPGGAILPARACAVRKSDEAIRIAQKKLRRAASKMGYKLRPNTLEWAEYVTVLTTFPDWSMPPAEVLESYRGRWQVELVFKRFKQIAELGHLPKHDGESCKAWLYGKLFAVLMAERVIEYAESLSPWGY